jgi:hypothetical protein
MPILPMIKAEDAIFYIFLNLNRIFNFSGENFDKRGINMESEDFFRVITEFEFICEDIGEIKEQIDLTKSEIQKISQAITSVENAKKILTELFPKIESLTKDLREDLTSEFVETG